MKNATFGQWYTGVISVLSLIILAIIFGAVLHNPTVLNNAAAASFLTALVGAIIGTLVACYKYITGSTSGSQAKDDAGKETISNLIQQLGQSQPATKN